MSFDISEIATGTKQLLTKIRLTIVPIETRLYVIIRFRHNAAIII